VYVGTPKSPAGRRTVSIPPHLVPVLDDHLRTHVQPDSGSLLSPARHGGHMAPASLYRVWYPAREAAGRPDLRFHDLRHTGATLAAATGATLADLMQRLGHSTPAAALRHQHAVADRDRASAEALSGRRGQRRAAAEGLRRLTTDGRGPALRIRRLGRGVVDSHHSPVRLGSVRWVESPAA
jgi:integrase